VDFEELASVIFRGLKPKLEANPALAVFAKQRKRFEGWLKVEVCEALLDHFNSLTPEARGTDLTFDDWGLDLKPVTTNYTFVGVETKTKNITKTIADIIGDIERLKSRSFANKVVLFVAYPLLHDNLDWHEQLSSIPGRLRDLKHQPFRFLGGVPGEIYLGLV